jgi:predicted porin
MKRSLLALAALTAFAGAASAQSTVTLFGVVDVSAMSVSNGSAKTTKTLAQDGVNSSRIGFRGVEDLGGGLRAGFHIEGAFGPDTGCGGSGTLGTPSTCAGQTWQRRSTASLIGGFGEIRLGRDYTPQFNNIAAFDPWGYNGVAHVGNVRDTLGSGATTQVRANNTIAYFLPAMGGLYGQVQVAAGEGSTGNKDLAFRLGYAAGPLNVGGAWAKTYKVNAMIDDYKTINFGASFNAGFATFEGAYEKNDYSTKNQKVLLLGLLVPVGSGTFKASFVKTSGSSKLYEAKQFGLGYVYDLSKRTALYAQYARINNSGNAALGSKYAVYGANGGSQVGFVGGETSSGFQFGIRHFF